VLHCTSLVVVGVGKALLLPECIPAGPGRLEGTNTPARPPQQQASLALQQPTVCSNAWWAQALQSSCFIVMHATTALSTGHLRPQQHQLRATCGHHSPVRRPPAANKPTNTYIQQATCGHPAESPATNAHAGLPALPMGHLRPSQRSLPAINSPAGLPALPMGHLRPLQRSLPATYGQSSHSA
jgi:hypothetical protein